MKIVVIGADRGLGAVLTHMLAERGHTVVAGLHRMESSQKECGKVLYLPMDVSKEEVMNQAARTISEQLGEIDAVVNVAGVLLPSDRKDTLLTENIEDIREQMDVNALGIVIAFRAMYRSMKKGGRFFAVTSEGGSFTSAGSMFPAYSVSKTAANKFVQVLRLTVGDEVEVVAVHPGRMNTEMGRETAQIEPEVAAEGFCRLLEDETKVNYKEHWFIDYLGNPMPL